MRQLVAIAAVVALACAGVSFCAAAPVAPANPCLAGNDQDPGACNGSPAPNPTSTPGNGQPCTATPNARFASQFKEAGTTELSNNTCVPNMQPNVVFVDGKHCTGSHCTSANLDLYAVICLNENQQFTTGQAITLCSHNFPYTSPGARPMQYTNPNKIHANEAYGFFGSPACGNPGTGIKIYGTPTNPQGANPPGEAGDTDWHEQSRVHLQFFTDAAHALYWSSQDGCQSIGTVTIGGPSPVTPGQTVTVTINGTPVSYGPVPIPPPVEQPIDVATFLSTAINAAGIPNCSSTSSFSIVTVTCTTSLSTLTSSTTGSGGLTAVSAISNPDSTYMADTSDPHVMKWWQSYDSGTTVSGVNAGTAQGASGFDLFWGMENDTSNVNIQNQITCKNTPCNTVGINCTQEWGCSDSTMTNHRITLFNSLNHLRVGSLMQGQPFALMFNGLADALTTDNTCELGTLTYTSPNVLMGEAEQVLVGFSNHSPETRQWPHGLNCFSQVLNSTTGLIFYEDHERAVDVIADNYQMLYNHFAFYLLTFVSQRVTQRLDLDDQTSQPQFSVYPPQLFQPAPGDGHPRMSAFFPTNCSGCDANGYDPNSGTDGNWGSGADTNDRVGDHGAVDLAMGSSCSAGLVDYKGHPVCVYFSEFDNMFYFDTSSLTQKTIQTEFSLAGNYMAAVMNPSTSTITIQCGDLPRHTYHHSMRELPLTPVALGMDIFGGGGVDFGGSFACGTGSATVAPESSRILVD